MNTVPQIVFPVVIPLFAAFLLPIARRCHGSLGDVFGRGAVLLSFLASALLAWQVADSGPASSAIGGFRAPLGIVFYADTLAMAFVLLLNIGVWLFWPAGAQKSAGAQTLMLVLLGGGAGLVLSGDLFNIFVFYEIVAVASYGLAASGGSAAGFGASLRYLLLGALGSSLALMGIALIYATAGTLNLADLALLAPHVLRGPAGAAAFLLLLIGFGVKAELFPVNSWVPEVYASAPVRVTSLLAGIVSKLAMVVILRFLVLVFPIPSAYGLLLVIGIFGVLAGELAAYRARDLNATFAWSSIAQLGVIAIAFSIPGPAGIAAGIALALHHAVVKPAFFFIADKWRGDVQLLGGGAKVAPLVSALFVLLSLSIIGIPPLPGFWAKYMLLDAAFAVSSPAYGLAVAVVLAGAVVEAAYLFRAAGIFYGRAPAGRGVPLFLLGELAPAFVLGAVLIIAMLALPVLGGYITSMAVEAADAPAIASQILIGGK
ncbi:MAG TPA: NADH-quinone oxidoreductase subunit J [Rhizobiales bacterium]|nr:NADH-quinone oxidoreductase subunit J [Hyphomicrobiales bacterium]